MVVLIIGVSALVWSRGLWWLVGWLLVVFAGWCLVRWWSTRAAARPPSPTNPNQP